jgi:hypothetical protein
MHNTIQWRAALGQAIAAAYAVDPKVGAVALGGSVARGWADRHSDIELFVFWHDPPSDTDRFNAVSRAGGRIDVRWSHPPATSEYQQIFEATHGRMGQVWPYEDEEWSEHFYVCEVDIGVSGFLSSTVEQYLVDVVDGFDTAERKHILLAAIASGVPLTAAAGFAQWQARAAAYPAELARAVVAQQLACDGDWWDCEKLAGRDERHLLYPLLSHMVWRMSRMLLALNRCYLPDPRLKWLDRLIGALPITPVNCSTRLQALYRMEPVAAVQEMQQLFEETLDLVDNHLFNAETTFARRWYQHRRVQWSDPPSGVSKG